MQPLDRRTYTRTVKVASWLSIAHAAVKLGRLASEQVLAIVHPVLY